MFGVKKTLTGVSSAFDRVNVRLLFLYMETAIASFAKFVVFEQNDSLTQSIFKNLVNPFLQNIQGRQGISDFLVDVGATVNTPQVVQNNEFIANIYVAPIYSAEFIQLNFIATSNGVNFSELTA